MTGLEEARAQILQSVSSMARETVALKQSAARIAADSVMANHDLPLFDNSAMDGFAVRSVDVSRATMVKPVKLRIAVNTRQKDAQGNWGDKPNYFDVTVWGNQGESCAQYLSKGRPVGVDGRLDWREWEAQDGTKRQAVEIIADSVQFLGSREGGGVGEPQFVPAAATAATDTADFGPGGADDDIPF